jgi:3-hydroxyisobutyrate dehydrogenase-like beta-hydroxyacid dehydrogenase
MNVGLLHPGAMGAAVGRQLTAAGHEVRWCSAGRSAATAERAEAAGLRAMDSLAEVLDGSTVVLSVCPPAFAEDVAREVAEAGYAGIFVDANAIGPDRMGAIAELFTDAEVTVVDGGIIGPPPGPDRTARLYLSGPAEEVNWVHGLFTGTRAEPVRIDGKVGTASALKIAYGSFQKASRALAAVSHALADSYGVTDHLLSEARALGPNALIDREHFPSVAARAWRWAPEMIEGAETFAALGLPGDLATGASAVFHRWDADKDADLDVDTALRHLRDAD